MASAAAMFEYTVYPDQGEPFVVEATMREVLKWERSTPKGQPARKAEDLGSPSATAAYELAWLGARQAGKYSGPLTDFEQSNVIAGGDRLTPQPDDAADEDEVAALDPTRPEA